MNKKTAVITKKQNKNIVNYIKRKKRKLKTVQNNLNKKT